MHADGLRTLTLFTHTRHALASDPFVAKFDLDMKSSFFSKTESLGLRMAGDGPEFDNFPDWLTRLHDLGTGEMHWLDRIYTGDMGTAEVDDAEFKEMLKKSFVYGFVAAHKNGHELWIGGGSDTRIQFTGGAITSFVPPPPLKLADVRQAMRDTLAKVEEVCREAGKESAYGKTFGVAARILESDCGAFDPNAFGLPEAVATLVPESKGLAEIAAAQICRTQFGGMGSWNDTEMANDPRCEGLHELTRELVRAAVQ